MRIFETLLVLLCIYYLAFAVFQLTSVKPGIEHTMFYLRSQLQNT